MLLADLLGEGPGDVEIAALAYDNRSVSAGTLFFCVPGFTRDGHDFAADAVARGAAALVVERPLGLGVPEVVADSARAAMARAAARFHGDPSARLRVAGITGTSGKTTTAFLLHHLLVAGGVPSGLLGTVKALVGGKQAPTAHTTPEAIDLQALLAQMLAAGDRACAMEVSSHALALHRADAIDWAAAVFCNLSQDHLDFHPDMESYFEAKRLLFEATSNGARIACIDDRYGRRLAADYADAITFGLSDDADYRAAAVACDLRGSSFELLTPAGRAHVTMPLPGRFNVLNALGATAAARALGVSLEAIVAALGSAPPVPGRFHAVDEGQPFAVVVDYSHKPDALANALDAARAIAPRGRVICVFGAGGDRDRTKRPVMGRVASQRADLAIVTSDNPRNEDPEAIIAAVAGGAVAPVETEVDRRTAIERAVALAAEGDVVLIAGKGHEQGQELAGGRKLPFDDVAVARDALRALLAAHPEVVRR